jgi:6-phosphogluconolactonase
MYSTIRRLGRYLLGPLVLAVGAGGVFALPAAAAAAAAATPNAPIGGPVYLDGNTAGANTIAAYDRHPDGTLTATPGSPFAAGGAGLGTGLGSQGAIGTAAHGRFVLAVDAGSNQISVLGVNRDGSLTPVPGSPVSSGGVQPVSIAVHQHLVYVANDGNATESANYTGFFLTPFGQLVPLPNSTVSVPGAANDLGDVLFNGNGTKLVGTEVATSVIDSFGVDRLGYLKTAPGSPYPAQGVGPFGSAFRPTNPNQLFVSNAHNGAGLGTVSAYDDAANGKLFSIGGSPFADLQTAPCWVAVTPDGQSLFAINTGSGTVSSYSIDPSGNLTLAGSTPVNDNGGVGGTDPAISTDGQNLYINETAAHGVAEFSINNGNLTELPNSPIALPASITASAGAAVTP